ncbi:50S ribosomal protein L17 [Candidatus Zixiibacteriota bacterium]|nr:50S ribosomal protein L17 [candidate division Zixibacteria bacterium]
MRHQMKVKKLSRPRPHREAMLDNMVTSLLAGRMIETTEARAKELRRRIDRIIVTAKKDSLAARRQLARTIKDRATLKKLFTEIIPQFKDRPSGFSRVAKVGHRRGDGAMVAVVELLTEKPKVEKEKGKKKSGEKKKEKEAVAAETGKGKGGKSKAKKAKESEETKE